MCIIAYKPNGIDFPSDTILKNCYDNNPDGAGFMYAYNGNVHIQKGYTSWTAFKNALDKARKLTGNKVPYVMHFRIATQGFQKTMTHPFPLSSKMENLKQLKYNCNIGVAHNGIINLTSDGSKDYSDTMKFITDYLSNIIQSYSWYKNKRFKALIEHLIEGSRLAILDKNGHCELLGKTWEQDDNGVWYSNGSWSYSNPWRGYSTGRNGIWDDYWDSTWYGIPKTTATKTTKKSAKKTQGKVTYSDSYEKYYDFSTGDYRFTEDNCPYTLEDDDGYCHLCRNYGKCKYIRQCFDTLDTVESKKKEVKTETKLDRNGKVVNF